jgi:hypothetical protein
MKPLLLWCCAIAVAAALLVAADFRSRDPDSALYARISGELALQPPSRWIAPEWGGAWNQQGLFREHPVGILLPSVLLIRAGVPAAQAAYIANLFYQAAVIALIPLVAVVLMTRAEARALAWVLQLLPVSFVYRIRGNQEHPLLMCFLALLWGTERARTQPAWIVVMVLSFCGLVLVKGAFAMFALVAAVLWLFVVPSPAQASDRWAWLGLGAAVLSALAMMTAYEAIYVRTTGDSFLEFYRSTRLGQSIQLTDPRVIPHALVNVGWYAIRLAWFAAPWSLAAFAVIGVWLRTLTQGTTQRVFTSSSARGIAWAVLTTCVFVAVLSPALVRAERFVFPAYFIVAAVGFVAVARGHAGVGRLVERTAGMPSLPVAVWLLMFLVSLGSRVLR